MSKEKPSTYMVKLIRGASFTTPGQKFLPGNSVPVSDPKLLEVLKRSQQFKITEGDDGESEAEPEGEDESGDDSSSEPRPTPKKKKKRK